MVHELWGGGWGGDLGQKAASQGNWAGRWLLQQMALMKSGELAPDMGSLIQVLGGQGALQLGGFRHRVRGHDLQRLNVSIPGMWETSRV
eukprot:NODE_3707_length_413_cov_23.508242_g3271_i0.p2 GENE.NODE_3707_length_413_cov_23.508242_g3271_i0~~NODE_3707_length_413_cov_23.508242_g3271_i0.p2  ORF type:complete len:89 (+),score=8.83 NODE_3707_length_413_cov_23.508242_g3271_i0:61-327(+)